mgnify:CR=1 FL=1
MMHTAAQVGWRSRLEMNELRAIVDLDKGTTTEFDYLILE